MTMPAFNLANVDDSWRDCLQNSLNEVDAAYLKHLHTCDEWLPGPDKIFNAFSLPVAAVNYVLIGESPYPRRESANGYAFWDANVKDLWLPTGLSKPVNRATSLRNILKMLLLAEGLLDENHTDQASIAAIDKTDLVKTNAEFFHNFLAHGFLLLNASPVLQDGPPQKDAKAWQPFIDQVLDYIVSKQPSVKFVLFGRIAHTLEQFIEHHPNLQKLCAEHPYNVSFITNKEVIDFFRPLHLLKKYKK